MRNPSLVGICKSLEELFRSPQNDMRLKCPIISSENRVHVVIGLFEIGQRH